MGSIETLRDFTTDFLIVEFENENILYSMTLENIRSAEEWSSVIVSYLDRLSGYEEKYS
jgi:hypothetical protein